MTDGRDAAHPREIELKLELEPQDLDRIRAHPLLDDGLQSSADSRVLRSVYFDTEDLVLRQAGMSLRVRSDGARRIQTLKAQQSPDQVVLDRTEWEHEVGGDEPDLSAARGTPLDALAGKTVLDRALKPQFVICVHRTALALAYGGSDIELALDQGEVARDGQPTPFAELELELKHGSPADLFRLALALAAAAPLRLSFTAKSDRGYALIAGEGPQPVKAPPIDLDRGMTSAAAFQAICRSCLRHLMANESVLRQRRDADAVHQMRVALRRLRAAVSVFKAMLADDQREPIRTELRWMANALGEVRDLDVWIAKVLAPARSQNPEAPGLADCLAEAEARRDRAYDAAAAAIASPRFLRDVLATAAWIEAGAWLARGDKAARRMREQPIEDHAADELARRWKRVRRRGKHLQELAPDARHQVRIEVKKLRYATEFFQSLFAGRGVKKRRREALALFERLQETLGDLNDIAVGTAMRPQGAAAALLENQASRSDDLLADARSTYRDFARLKPFWEAA